MQNIYKKLMEYTKNRFMGISFAYINKDGRIITEYEGYADKENNILVDEKTIFPACSMSKFITAICVMVEHDKKVIDIDEPVNKYLKGWKLLTPNGNESDASIRLLLCHLSGVVDGEDGFYGLRRSDSIVSLIDVLEGKTSYNNKPVREEYSKGTVFEYSDAGYCILQLLLQEVNQKPFEEIANEYIFEPLNLNYTFFASKENVDYYENKYLMATGYDEEGLTIPGKYPQVPDLAAAGLWSTPKELIIIGKEFAKACNGESEMLTKESAIEITKPVENFTWTGLGVFMGAENEIISRGWGENGQSMMKINYSTGEVAVVMTNQNPGVDQSESGIEDIINKMS